MYRVHRKLLSVVLSVAAALPAGAQHVHPAATEGPNVGATTTLTTEQVRELLNGDGMGFAKPAELQRYPGPKHLLERAAELGLTAEQQRMLTSIRERVLAEAKGLGREIVDAERRLDATFAANTVTGVTVAEQTTAIASLYGRLRAVHLRAHLEALPLLTPAQVEKYYAGS